MNVFEKLQVCTETGRTFIVIVICKLWVLQLLLLLIINVVEPSGVQVFKNPNPLKDVEALAVLDVAVLV